MAVKKVSVNGGRAQSTNKRYVVAFTLAGKKYTTAGMLFGGKDAEQTAVNYVARTLRNMGITGFGESMDATATDKR